MTVHRRLESYGTLLDAFADAPPTQTFVSMWDPRAASAMQTLTFGEFRGLATAYAHMYRERGVRPRDTIVLVLDQGVPLLAAFAGALIIGAIPTILAYPTFKVDPEKYRHGLSGVTRNLRASLVVLDEKFPEPLAAHITGATTLRVNLSPPPGETIDTGLSVASPDDVAFIQHSAGTTGLQKAVALPHRSVLNQLRGLAEALELQESDQVVSWLPLYHDMGLIACFILPLVAHLPVVMQSPTDWALWPYTFLRLASEHRSTLCWLPNFAFQFLARRVSDEQRRSLDLSALRAVINCSEPVRTPSMEEFYNAFRAQGLAPSALQCSYAMAETTFAVTQTAWRNSFIPLYVDHAALSGDGRVVVVPSSHPQARPLLSSGRCLRHVQVRVTDAEGRDAPLGAIGELVVRSDALFEGYHGRPDLTAQVLRDGWYWTGDTGFVWGGDVYVLGRKDDIIIVAGKNLYPQDIEEAASGNPFVHDGRAVALGLFNPEAGTQDLVVVAEVNAEEALTRSTEIQADIRQRIVGEVGVAPRFVFVVPPKWIVKSTAGKPARSTTRRRLLSEHPELDTDQKR